MDSRREDLHDFHVVVKCNTKIAEVFPPKLHKKGKAISKCIKHSGKWLSPTEFEALARQQQTRQWRQSIKCEGKPLGEWLVDNGYDPGLDGSQKSADQSREEDSQPDISPCIYMSHVEDNNPGEVQQQDTPVVHNGVAVGHTPLTNLDLAHFNPRARIQTSGIIEGGY